MIDPKNITNVNRTQEELEEFILFGMCVAGKNARIQAKKLESFLDIEKTGTPFEKIRTMIQKGTLDINLRKVKMGKYSLLNRGFSYVATQPINLESVTAKELEAVPGIGMKTSRFFILHNRENPDVACLDTHILKWLKKNTKEKDIPKKSPSKKKTYKRLESAFLKEAKKRNLHPAKLDINIWRKYSN